MLAVLETMVREAGDISRKYFAAEMRVTEKEDGSPVTNADIEISQYIESTLRAQFPGIGILSEEGPQQSDLSDSCWIIDPIDGTSNFISGNPNFSISVALVVNNESELGIVYTPALGDIYTASRGKGAFKNTEKIRVSTTKELASAYILLDTGTHEESLRIHGALRKALTTLGARAQGNNCASLDLCRVGEGLADAFIHRGLKAWDIATGMLIAEEAGAKVTNLQFGKKELFSSGIIATTPGVYSELETCVSHTLDELHI